MIEWKTSPGLTPYEEAVAFMEERAKAVHEGRAPELVWFLEHPAIYTAGTSAKPEDLLQVRFPVHKTGRGGQYTYHGPGQRVVYVVLDLKHRRAMDVRRYVCNLERWAIEGLAEFGIRAERRDKRIGLWVDAPPGEKKIAAIGVRLQRWVTLHGMAVNIDPDLSHFSGIVPCGISEHGVTSMSEVLGRSLLVDTLDEVLRKKWHAVFEKPAAQEI